MTNAKYYAGPIPADRIAEEYHEEYCKSGAPFKLPEEDLCFEPGQIVLVWCRHHGGNWYQGKVVPRPPNSKGKSHEVQFPLNGAFKRRNWYCASEGLIMPDKSTTRKFLADLRIKLKGEQKKFCRKKYQRNYNKKRIT